MLAGLLFAIAEAEDRPGRLTATLPFGGVTLIEYQARGLVAAGAAQLVVVVARMTPELLGALSRIGRRGVAVDTVRTAAEAAEKLHPLARVLMLADGLVTTDEAVAALARDPAGGTGEALLVQPDIEAGGNWERIGARMAWAGIARLDPRRVVELALLPAEYDVQSTLLRLVDQAGAAHVALPAGVARHGHGIEHRAAALAARGRLVLAAMVGDRRSWFDRWVLGPIARLALPPLVDRAASGAGVGGAGAAVAALGLVALGFGWTGTGTLLAFLGCVALALGTTLSELRDEMRVEAAQRIAVIGLPAVVALGIGVAAGGDGQTALVLAVAGVVAGATAERATPEWGRRSWWATPPAYLLILAIGAIAGVPVVGLAAAAAYAAATLAAGVETLRVKP